MAELILNRKNFNRAVLNSDRPVLVDFWAEWCGPCKMLSPVLTGISEQYKDSITVGKVNVDAETYLPVYYGVQSIPTLIMFRDGKSEKRLVGYHSTEDIVRAFGLDERSAEK